MIWTLLALFAMSEVAFGLYLWRKRTAQAETLAATDPVQAADIRRAALRLAGVFLLSPFMFLIAGWLAVGPPDFTW
jgi:hypothetical protein